MAEIILTDANGTTKYREAPWESSEMLRFVAMAMIQSTGIPKMAWKKRPYKVRKAWIARAKVACDAMVAYSDLSNPTKDNPV